METLDPRLHAFRPDLADEALRGRVEAQNFVKGVASNINVPVASVRKAPSPSAMQLTQALFGETCSVFETKNGWAWIKLKRDGYVGYVEASDLLTHEAPPTHYVKTVFTIHFPQADLKSQPVSNLYFGSQVAVSGMDRSYALLATGGAVHAAHLAKLGEKESDHVAVAERFLGVAYLWGGKTQAGLDCSGLVQIGFQACGLAAPRDSDQQEKALGKPVNDYSNLRRGDLVFWPGHVGLMQSASQIIHANGYHMMVTSEPLAEVVARSEKPISSIKRL